jgi:transcriptional regulator with XRE-family HTH domain
MNAQVKGRKKLAATELRNLRTLLLLSVFEPEDIGARIAAARHEAGLTQEELADLVGVSTRSLQGYEGGDVVPYRHMQKLAEVTRRPAAWLLHGDAAEDERTNAQRLDRIEEQLAEIRGMLARLLRDEAAPRRRRSNG